MPMMHHVREYVMTTKTGHTIAFKGANTPVFVPDPAVSEAMAAGAAPFEGTAPDNSGIVETKQERNAKAPQGADRKAVIKEELVKIFERNDQADFNARGVPNAKVVEKSLGFQVTAQEILPLWLEVKHAND